MPLGQYTPRPSKGKTNSFKPQDAQNQNKPLLVVPREYIAGFESDQYSEQGPRDVLIWDVVDLMADKVVPTVMTGSGAIRDDMKRFVPGGEENPSDAEQLMAVKIVAKPGRTNTYFALEQLAGAELQLAAAWEATHGIARIHAERAAYEASNGEATGNGDAASQVAALQAQLATLQGGAANSNGASNVTPLGQTNPAASYNDAALAAAIAKITSS